MHGERKSRSQKKDGRVAEKVFFFLFFSLFFSFFLTISCIFLSKTCEKQVRTRCAGIDMRVKEKDLG